MFKINWKKWRDALTVEEALGHPERLTLLYSIRALGRGRVHRTWGQPSGYGSKLILDAAWQATYVGERWKEYVDQRAAMDAAFNATPEELGAAAVAAAMK